MQSDTMESAFYEAIVDSDVGSVEACRPEDLICAIGSVLIVVPPDRTESRGTHGTAIQLPDVVAEPACVGRVATVPDDPECPVKPGFWILFRKHSGMPVMLGGREDLKLIQYTHGPASEILAWFVQEPCNKSQPEACGDCNL